MGLFDKMFGRGASDAQQQPKAEQRFNVLKQKYQSVLNAADQQQIQFQNLHVQDDKLFIKGIAPSEDAKGKFWDQIKLVNPSADDITADISVDKSRSMGAAAGGGAGRVAKPIPLKLVIICRRSASSSTETRTSTCRSFTQTGRYCTILTRSRLDSS